MTFAPQPSSFWRARISCPICQYRQIISRLTAVLAAIRARAIRFLRSEVGTACPSRLLGLEEDLLRQQGVEPVDEERDSHRGGGKDKAPGPWARGT